jgi:hypothetical protein
MAAARREATPGRRVHRYFDPDVTVEIDPTVFDPPHFYECPYPVCDGELEVQQARWMTRWAPSVLYRCRRCGVRYVWQAALRPVAERGLMGPRKRRRGWQ